MHPVFRNAAITTLPRKLLQQDIRPLRHVEVKLGSGPGRRLSGGRHDSQQYRQENPHRYDSIDDLNLRQRRLFSLRLQNRGAHRLTLPGPVFGQFSSCFGPRFVRNLDLIAHRDGPPAPGQPRRHTLMLDHVSLAPSVATPFCTVTVKCSVALIFDFASSARMLRSIWASGNARCAGGLAGAAGFETAAPEAATVAAWPSPATAAARTRAQRYFFTLSEAYSSERPVSVALVQSGGIPAQTGRAPAVNK